MTAKKLFGFYMFGVLLFAVANMLVPIPCIWKTLFGIPCAGCGLNRAFVLILRGEFIEAFRMNILALPIFIGMAIGALCGIVELLFKKPALKIFSSVLETKSVLYISVFSAVASWAYNIASNA